MKKSLELLEEEFERSLADETDAKQNEQGVGRVEEKVLHAAVPNRPRSRTNDARVKSLDQKTTGESAGPRYFGTPPYLAQLCGYRLWGPLESREERGLPRRTTTAPRGKGSD